MLDYTRLYIFDENYVELAEFKINDVHTIFNSLKLSKDGTLYLAISSGFGVNIIPGGGTKIIKFKPFLR